MAGLRERKKHATRLAIHEAGMLLFAEHGFTATTVDAIADAAGVSRATVFTYFPSKEEIVFGDAAAAVDLLAQRLRERPAGSKRSRPCAHGSAISAAGWSPASSSSSDSAATCPPSAPGDYSSTAT